MSLNIKNERVCAMAKEAAHLTGRSQTATIEEALRQLIEGYGPEAREAERQRRLARIREIVERWNAAPKREGAIENIEDLYDPETGLPA